MDSTSFLAECLTECVSSYAGIDGYNKREYIMKRGYDLLERELKVKDYLVNIVKCVNKCIFNKNVLSENVDKKISFSEIVAVESAKNEKYPFEKTKELYFAIFDALKEFHDNYIYNKSIDVNEKRKSRRPINNKKFMELDESEFARDYFLFTFIAKTFIPRIQAKANDAYQEYFLDDDVREYYKSYMGSNYKGNEIIEEVNDIKSDDKELLEVLLNNGFEYKMDEESGSVKITSYRSKLKKAEFPAYIDSRVLDYYYSCFNDYNFESEEITPIEEVIFNSERIELYNSLSGCPNLKKVTVKGEIVAVDQDSFLDCDLIEIEQDGIKYIKINDNSYYIARKLEDTTKEYLMIDDDTHILASFFAQDGEENVLDLANVKYIMDYAFTDNLNLEKVIMSLNLKYIGDCAFMNCENLKEIEFPRSLKKIGDCAFEGTSLKMVRLPLSCKVGESSFPEDCVIERF